MAKRKRGGPRPAAQNEVASQFGDRSASKLKINSFEDVADSEDEFMLGRDKILLDTEPATKKSRHAKEEDKFLQHSDEEVLGYSASSDEEDDALKDGMGVEKADEDVEAESDDEMVGWGNSKSAFYNTDKITTEEEALAEEQEARRLQQKRLKSLTEADFGLDELDWAAAKQEDDTREQGDEDDGPYEGGVVRETLPRLQISPDMTDAEKLKLLRRRFPHFEGFAKALIELQPAWEDLERHYKSHTSTSMLTSPPASVTRFRALSAYLGSLTMYFALLTSPARMSKDDHHELPLQPQELREHEVMEYVQKCQEVWESVKNLEDSVLDGDEDHAELPYDEQIGNGASKAGAIAPSEIPPAIAGIGREPKQQAVPSPAVDARIAAPEARRAARRATFLQSLDSLNARLAKPTRSTHKLSVVSEDDHDFGDEAPLDEREAAEKARRKKSLRFYTSRIAQKANKDARFADAAGGDEDIPYKERFRDKVERLNREAEARGKRASGEGMNGADDEDLDGDDLDMTNADREAMDNGDDDYRQLMGQAQRKKDSKRQREAAYQEAKEEGVRVERVAQQEIGPDGRREIGYTIAKNKGLTPKRRKEVKNPRVRRRQRFEDKTKKLKTMKPTYKGGEGRGGYGGELTGIKTGLVKSVKL